MRNLFLLLCFLTVSAIAQDQIKLGLLVYRGGGDWYANPTSLPNLAKFCNQHLKTNIQTKYDEVNIGSKDIFNYPYVYLTGHGNIVLNAQEKENLIAYLQNGGFVHVDDNYGLDAFVRPLLYNLLPNQKLQEIPHDHLIYQMKFPRKNGLPKIHEHDGLPPQAFGLFHNGKLVLLYTYECDLGNGWEDRSVHNDPEEIRQEALKMGANIIEYVFTR
jgi:hypothetical protein